MGHLWVVNKTHKGGMENANDIEIYRKTFPAVLRRKRSILKLTREQLAERADTAVRYIAHLEDGTRQPTLSTFCKLAYALEIDPAKFMKEFQDALPQSMKDTG